MMRPEHAKRSRLFLGILCVSLLGGCRVSSDEIHNWARKATGPVKLEAVVTRVSAASLRKASEYLS